MALPQGQVKLLVIVLIVTALGVDDLAPRNSLVRAVGVGFGESNHFPDRCLGGTRKALKTGPS